MFSAIFKFLGNLFTLGGYKANKAADDVLTNSPDGIRAAFDQATNNLKQRSKNIIDAISLMAVQEAKAKSELKKLDEEEIKLAKSIEGILVALELNPNDLEAVQDYDMADKRQQEIDARQAELLQNMEQFKVEMKEYQLSLNAISGEISKLEKESNVAVADMEIAKMKEEIESQKAGLTTSVDMSGVDAVRNKIAEKKAKVDTLKMANGSNVNERMAKYENLGSTTASNAKLQEVLAQRSAMKNAKVAGGASTESTTTTEGAREL